MKKKISVLIAGTAVGILAAVGSASPASAAHCVEDGSPGFSYFGQEGRTQGGNVGNPGATECAKSTTLPRPSTRAPGQNKP